MTEYYKHEFYLGAKRQRKKTLFIYFAVAIVYLGISVFNLVWYINLPYNSGKITLVKWIQYPISGLFVIFSFIYLGIIFKRINRYYKMCINIETGIKETSSGSFFEYDESIQDKDGVDFKALVFIEWNKYKKDFFERKVLVFYEKPFPEITKEAKVKYTTQGNVLVEYEIEN